MSIGNITCEDCNLNEGHILLAILPTPSKNKGTHLRRLEMFHEYLEVFLKPFKKGSFKYLLYMTLILNNILKTT
jgi:hypothetical protein